MMILKNGSLVLQSPGTPDDFERALQDLRAKAAAGRLETAGQPVSAGATAPAVTAAPAFNGGVSAFSAAAIASPPHSSNSSNGSGNRGSGSGGPGPPEQRTVVNAPRAVAAANPFAAAAVQQPPRPMSRGKNYDLLLGD